MAETSELDSLLRVHDAYAGDAYGSDTDGGELSRQRGLSLDAFAGKNIEPQPEGRSQVVDWTVFETIQWILPSLCRIFAGGDDIVEFDPFGPDDEDAAKQESQYLNHLVVKKNNWFMTVLTWCQDALTTKNAYCMAMMEKKLRTEVDEYIGQSEMQVTAILEDDVEVVEQRIYPDPDAEPQPVVDEQTGEPMIDVETGELALEPVPNLIDIKVRKTKATEKLKYRILPPEHCLVDSNCPDFTLDECDYFEFWDNVTISHLRSLGYEVEDDIGEDGDWDTIEDNARDEILKNVGIRDRSDNPDKSTRKVKARWVWMAHDYDDDGIAEMNHFLRVGEEILVMKDGPEDGISQVSQIPVSSIVPFINTHRHIGASVSDLVFDIQRIKTAILRQGLDSLYYANNPRPTASKKVNMDDLLVSRPGSPIRIDSELADVDGHIGTLPMPFVFPQAQEGLRHMDTVTEARVGVNRLFQGIDESNSNDHDRIGQLSTMASQRVEQIARIFGNGFERLFKISHELIIKSGHKAETIQLNGQWVEFNPTEWKTGRDMTVVAPFAAGNKDSLIQRLMLVRGIHSEAAAAGHPMVQADDSYELAKEISRAADLPDYKFFTDPQTVEPPPPPPDHTMLALELESQKIASKDEENRLDHEFKMRELEVESELDKYKADLSAEVDLIVAGAKDEGQVRLEQVRATLKDQTENGGKEVRSKIDSATRSLESLVTEVKQVTRDLERVREDAEAPIEIVRDKKGKITGKNVNGKFIPIKRSG